MIRLLSALCFAIGLLAYSPTRCSAQAPNWISASNAGGRGIDFSNGVVADAAGNRYVVGDFNTDTFNVGNLLVRRHDSDYTSIFLTKYSPAGAPLWVKNVANGPIKTADGLGIDRSGNLYVTGRFYDSIRFGTHRLTGIPVYTSFYCAKLDSSGNGLWVRGADTNSGSEGHQIAVQPDGTVSVIGAYYDLIRFGSTQFQQSGTRRASLFAISYDASGNRRWVKDGASPSGIFSDGICAGADGNVYLSGIFADSIRIGTQTIRSDQPYVTTAFLAKIDGNGNNVWAKRPARNTRAIAHEYVAAGPRGDVILAGGFIDTLQIGAQILYSTRNRNALSTFVARFDSAGTPRWVASTDDRGDDNPATVTTDAAYNVYIAGYVWTDTVYFGSNAIAPRPSASNTFVAKYDSSGTVKWGKGVDGGEDNIQPHAICVGPRGDVTITGTIHGRNNRFGATTIGFYGDYDAFVATLDRTTGGLPQEASVAEPLRLYPNPTTGMFTLRAVALQGAAVTIYNALGACVYTGVSGGSTHRIDLSQQPDGLYFVRISGARSAAACTVLVRR